MPISYWLQTIAVAESIGMILPVVAFMMNIYLTLRGNWDRVLTSIPLRLVVNGWASYILVSYQGSHESLRAINLLTHFSQYLPAHAHLALMFFAASTVMGGIYYVIPRIYNCQIYSKTLANVQCSIYVVGYTFFFIGFTSIGLVQGTAWLHQGLPVWSVLPGLRPYMALRAIGGALIVINFSLFTYNIFATVMKRRPVIVPVRAVRLPAPPVSPAAANEGGV